MKHIEPDWNIDQFKQCRGEKEDDADELRCVELGGWRNRKKHQHYKTIYSTQTHIKDKKLSY